MKIVDLSRELYHRTPSYPGHPPVIHGVWKTHEESFAESGNVYGLSSMFISMPDHAGTHIESLCNLEALLGQGPFTFIGLPMKWRDGTGSPIRAVAVFDL